MKSFSFFMTQWHFRSFQLMTVYSSSIKNICFSNAVTLMNLSTELIAIIDN